jgi:hypothetical protein
MSVVKQLSKELIEHISEKLGVKVTKDEVVEEHLAFFNLEGERMKGGFSVRKDGKFSIDVVVLLDEDISVEFVTRYAPIGRAGEIVDKLVTYIEKLRR